MKENVDDLEIVRLVLAAGKDAGFFDKIKKHRFVAKFMKTATQGPIISKRFCPYIVLNESTLKSHWVNECTLIPNFFLA